MIIFDSPFTILSSVVFGKISAKMNRSHLRCACFFLSLKSLSAPTCCESFSSSLLWWVYLFQVKLWAIGVPPWLQGNTATALWLGGPPNMLFLANIHPFLNAHSSAHGVFIETTLVCQTAVRLMLIISLGTLTENKNCGLMAQQKVTNTHPTRWWLKASPSTSWKEL